ncbi:hypothetical protein [Streptomyces sp. AC1-42T]|uniref:hypothetical protein n=1 Tax=Streptomyces sp. AC1-42T TaxID=2218665 RepID=UPI000DAE2111|nr:hypothetical protein [Streptomyces sp. AC1-42T]PZT71512.1 hypothetical protein DNK55_32900 [Streptomyces sp. AC1-42T]
MPRLVATVYVRDPETFQWVTCEAGTEPEPRLAALILTPSAWEDGRAPEPADGGPSAADPDPGTPSPEPPAPPEPAETEKKPRARRPAAKPADE